MNELKQTNGMDERDEQKTATKKAGNTELGGSETAARIQPSKLPAIAPATAGFGC